MGVDGVAIATVARFVLRNVVVFAAVFADVRFNRNSHYQNLKGTLELFITGGRSINQSSYQPIFVLSTILNHCQIPSNAIFDHK